MEGYVDKRELLTGGIADNACLSERGRVLFDRRKTRG
jgi:hypothetical protein